ncbi:hypothetical protein J2X46_002253 [Nocardioides sp. BE266]|uniref:hypothetical protein n=1 Tax=Nocardioides sp. BE266 TaxID=2817725 RepID=UPI002856CC86|nr:hypothetical protein [Nocardioides sp. BE266]MDR7253268.1 hypothetical protein [Nocardioides sp. BE266]
MIPRAVVLPAVATALVLVATVGGSSPAAHVGGAKPSAVDLLSSAHPTGPLPTVVDRAYDVDAWVRSFDLSADAAAITSATCDGCVGESTTLQVVYASRARRARLDNVANAWAQECEGCTGTALSVQVVVLRGRPTTMPNNRALSVSAACTGCRTSAAAFQVVLVSDDAVPMSQGELADLRAWFEAQAAAMRGSVTGTLPEPPAPTEEPTPTTEPTPTSDPTPTEPTPTSKPAPTIAPPTPTLSGTSTRRARRDAASALNALERLLENALDAEAVSADVDLSR